VLPAAVATVLLVAAWFNESQRAEFVLAALIFANMTPMILHAERSSGVEKDWPWPFTLLTYVIVGVLIYSDFKVLGFLIGSYILDAFFLAVLLAQIGQLISFRSREKL
jgi:hypothetical protein